MATKFQRFFRKGFVKLSLIIIVILAIATTCLYIWFIHNANGLLIDLVNKKSGGKLKLELSRVNFNFLSSEVKVHKARITSTAEDKTSIAYRVSFQKVTFSTNSLWSAFFNNTLRIKKVKLYDPVIEVFSRRKDSTTEAKNELSLGTELGKLYHSAEDAIISLNTHSISLINARLILYNTPDSKKKPLVFSNIYFSLKKLNKNPGSEEKYVNNNNITFSSSNQAIAFTDGIHQLLFKQLVVQKGRNIILDSCTIIALPTQRSHSSYNIHFRKLALIGVDFNALYKLNLIKTDSVYCEEPIIDLTLNSSVADSNNKTSKGLPDPNKILREFAGDLDLGFLGVMNADIHLNITGRKRQSNIHSGKVNFQIKNLRINPDSSKLITMSVFNMLIKGYHLYNKDSSCIYSFDSIRFANDKLVLNNFSVHTTSGVNKIRSFRDYSMPYFELLGVDWPELIFDQNLKADEAVLRDPTINYKKTAGVQITKKSLLLTSHRSFDDLMDIGRLSIINGNVNLEFGENKSLQLQGFSLSFLGDNISDYKHVRFQKDIESLFFEKGYLEVGDINATLKNISFKTNDKIYVEQLTISDDKSGVDSKLNDISLKNIYSDENSGNIVLDGLQWNNGVITIKSSPHTKSPPKKTSLLFKDVYGNNTQFTYSRDSVTCDAFIKNIQVTSIQKINTEPIEIKGVKMNGKQLSFSNAAIKMASENFMLADNSQEFTNTHFENKNHKGILVMDIPSVRLINNTNTLFTKELNFKNILLTSPVIDFKKQISLSPASPKDAQKTSINIDHITMQEPAINVRLGEDVLEKKIFLSRSKGSEIKAGGIKISPAGINIAELVIKAQKAAMKGAERDLSVDNNFDANVSKINILKSGDSTIWNAILNKLYLKNSEGFTFHIKENKLFLKDISIGNCELSSGSVSNINKLLSSNKSVVVSTSAAKYMTKASSVQISNASFDAGQQLLKLDSFSIEPLVSRDSFIASHPYQIDYIKFHSGSTKLYGFDLIKYVDKNSVSIQKASLSQPTISVYRDKLPPFLEGVKKSLFTEQIKSIPFPVSINQILINDGKVTYTEKNEKNRLEGTLLLNSLNGNILNIKNYSNLATDSLSIVLAGRILDKAPFEMKLNQSYTDKLQGFTMALNLEPAPFNFLNPLMAPLSNVKFTSGNIDKLEMHAVGNDNSTQGDMKFYYHDLHIQLLKEGGVEKTAFIKRRESDLVNFFFLKNNNTSRTGLIYFKRLKDRSFFNYINKIIFSGLVTSTGAKNNNRYIKQLKKDSAANQEP